MDTFLQKVNLHLVCPISGTTEVLQLIYVLSSVADVPRPLFQVPALQEQLNPICQGENGIVPKREGKIIIIIIIINDKWKQRLEDRGGRIQKGKLMRRENAEEKQWRIWCSSKFTRFAIWIVAEKKLGNPSPVLHLLDFGEPGYCHFLARSQIPQREWKPAWDRRLGSEK